MVQEILHYEGAGHTFSMHTKDDGNGKLFRHERFRHPVSLSIHRVPLEVSAALPALMPALTLGCGAIGGSATSENVGPMNLLNLNVMWQKDFVELDEIKAGAPDLYGWHVQRTEGRRC